jgi:PAS domain-containing protein
MTAVDQRKRHFVYLRLILSLAVIVSASFYSKISPQTPLISLIFLVFVAISNVIFIFLPGTFFKDPRLHYAIFFIDLATVLIGSYLFTILDINLILAIFLTILMSALARSVGFSFLIALATNALYIYITFALSGRANMADSPVFFNVPYIFIVALHASFLAEKNSEDIREKNELEKIGKFLSQKAISVREQMLSVADFLEDIIQSFKYGIVILDNDGNIRIFNSKCEKMFNVKSSRAESEALVDLDFLGGIKEAIMNFKFNGVEIYEKKVAAVGKEYLVTISSISTKIGSSSGILCFIKEA